MELGLIAPLILLDVCKLTRIQYVLPYLLIQEKGYRSFYTDRAKSGNKVFLDASDSGWKRAPEALSTVEKALEVLTPTAIILPCYLFDYRKSLTEVSAYKSFKLPLIGSLTGCESKEYQRHYEELRDRGITSFLITDSAYRFCKDLPLESRFLLINTKNPWDLDLKDKDIVFTSFPISLGLQGRFMFEGVPSPPVLTYREPLTFPDVVYKNLKEVLSYEL